ncbi:flavodoxin-dependent (E)-4-hydroxy-3-methylbut-2-enyl-diphosphate synthase [Streptomyces sp. NPDC048337]|uniref:flavodoxin-dependent (E)-4-hydroxy-3-methylbut-2-enyl-diphosphate synthase n=1 Tax=Streptomyces sp. NPDC048337 TaxID=3365535 RepID=UPI0037179C76
MTTIDPGPPTLPSLRVRSRRRLTSQLRVESVPVGGGASVRVQASTTTLTGDADAILRQLARITATGCDIVRAAVPSAEDAGALPAMVAKSTMAVIADSEIFPCLGCGRLGVGIRPFANRIDAVLDGFPHPPRIAVMGRVANSPGESREADLGVSCCNGKGQIHGHGQVIEHLPESKSVDVSLDEARCLTDQDEDDSAKAGGLR